MYLCMQMFSKMNFEGLFKNNDHKKDFWDLWIAVWRVPRVAISSSESEVTELREVDAKSTLWEREKQLERMRQHAHSRAVRVLHE